MRRWRSSSPFPTRGGPSLRRSWDVSSSLSLIHIYITKPFNILELKARVRALLRRAGQTAQKEKNANRLERGAIAIDVDQRAAWKNGQRVDLTAKEFDLIELFLRNPGRVYSRENLLNLVWGYEYIGEFRTVDVHVRRLREKLEPCLLYTSRCV